MTTTMRALLSLLGQPFPNTILAAQLRATRTKNCVLYFAIADKAFEDLLDILIGIALCLFSHLPDGRGPQHTVSPVYFSAVWVALSHSIAINLILLYL